MHAIPAAAIDVHLHLTNFFSQHAYGSSLVQYAGTPALNEMAENAATDWTRNPWIETLNWIKMRIDNRILVVHNGDVFDHLPRSIPGVRSILAVPTTPSGITTSRLLQRACRAVGLDDYYGRPLLGHIPLVNQEHFDELFAYAAREPGSSRIHNLESLGQALTQHGKAWYFTVPVPGKAEEMPLWPNAFAMWWEKRTELQRSTAFVDLWSQGRSQYEALVKQFRVSGVTHFEVE